MPDEQKRPLLVETEGSTGVQLWVQLEPVFRVQISLWVNDTCLGYPAPSGTREDIVMSVPTLACAWICDVWLCMNTAEGYCDWVGGGGTVGPVDV
jgi:hypothetical protein